MEKEDQELTADWLLQHGFISTIPGSEDIMGAWDLSYPFNEGDLCFIEKKFNRRQFAVIMSLRIDGEEPKEYLHSILVRVDAGCGFVDIPHGFVEFPLYNFCLLYEAIRGIKL